MNPCCCLPNKLPAPRIFKSRMAILNPEPNSVNSLIACKRSSAVSVNTLLAECKNKHIQYDLNVQLYHVIDKVDLNQNDASSMINVFALGTSTPVSIMVVVTKMSYSPLIKLNMVSSKSRSVICP